MFIDCLCRMNSEGVIFPLRFGILLLFRFSTFSRGVPLFSTESDVFEANGILKLDSDDWP